MNDSPLVSVLMTAYNRERYIGCFRKPVEGNRHPEPVEINCTKSWFDRLTMTSMFVTLTRRRNCHPEPVEGWFDKLTMTSK